jgi:hypothetical protein
MDGFDVNGGSRCVDCVVKGEILLPPLSYCCVGIKMRAPEGCCVLFEPWVDGDVL